MKKFSWILLLAGLLFLGCEKKIVTDVHEVHWDRDMCTRCAMVVSERKHAVQVINPIDGRSYMFDDIGCSSLWFKNQKIDWAEKAIIWITDAKSGKWINAKTAFYDAGNISPMAYGFMAHESKDDIEKNKEIIMLDEVNKRVIKIGK